MDKVSILKYGTGNLNSITRALNHFGAQVDLVQNTNEILKSNKLILPGIGASRYVMDYLAASERIHAISEFIEKERPVLGICLGMQILLTESEEFGPHNTLNIIPGKVLNMKRLAKKIISPHMGWTMTRIIEKKKVSNKLISKDNHFYFAHSYYCEVDEENIYAYSSYFSHKVPTIISNNKNVWGTQFHPELSSTQGLEIIKNFINM